VIGGEGAVIMSQMDAPLLANRVLNLVPVDDLETRSRPSPAIPKPSAYGPRAWSGVGATGLRSTATHVPLDCAAEYSPFGASGL